MRVSEFPHSGRRYQTYPDNSQNNRNARIVFFSKDVPHEHHSSSRERHHNPQHKLENLSVHDYYLPVQDKNVMGKDFKPLVKIKTWILKPIFKN
jgi:hypothetical protein